ncbi:MAG: hypothetical protein JST86_13220 [Bacteroidetes bacterium]|nr:hypothetical protein [Bacteroidota bacterium]
MRFFSKFVIICNICFVISAVMQKFEKHNKAMGKPGELVPLPYVQNVVIILGFMALMVSAVFIIIWAGMFATKKGKQIPRWVVIFNFAALLAEIYWYFIDAS